MSSLYQLVGERLALQNKLEALDFDVDTIADTLEGDSLAIQSKIETYAYIITNMEALPCAMKEEEKRLADRRKAVEKRIENIKNWLLINMQHANINKITTPVFTIALQSNPASVIVDDETLIPADFFIQPAPTPPALDKAMIKRAIYSGLDVPGARLEFKQRIVIK